MTYLDMVNNVLSRLRERNVSTVAVNDYSKLIGTFINDAKREIENSWQWSVLRQQLSITTSTGVHTYELNDTRNRIHTMDVWNDTGDFFLRQKPRDWMFAKLNSAGAEQGQPTSYTYIEAAPDGDTQLQLWPVPDGSYDIIINAAVRELNMSLDSDFTLIPEQPILMLAYAKAIEERGEDAGVASGSAFQQAYKSLGDHVTMDANRHPEELCWKEV